MSRNSFADLASLFIRVGLIAYLANAESKMGQVGGQPIDEKVEIALFPDQKDRVERFRTDQQQEEYRARVKINKGLRERARADFQTARGTIHRQLLVDAEKRLQNEARDMQTRVSGLQLETMTLESARDTELQRAIVRPLVEEQLPTLPGIGTRLAEAILSGVFKGDLSDLHAASMVDGIGSQKQATINDWVFKQRSRLPDLLAQSFPGKQEILARHNPQIDIKHAALTKARNQALALQDLLQQVYKELDWLMPIGVADFEMAFAGDSNQQQAINRYLLGVFPPWEPIPDWFAAAVGTNPSDNGSQDPDIHSLDHSVFSDRFVIPNQ